MPPLVATTRRVKPLTPASCGVEDRKHHDLSCSYKDWLDKVHAQKKQVGASHRHQWNILQRTLTGLSRRKHHAKRHVDKDNEPHSYKEELQKYIAESTATLSCEDEPQDKMDDSNDLNTLFPCSTDIHDVSDSTEIDEYVMPPVEVPRSYCMQDRQGGTLVAGHFVTFTDWAFKRQLRHFGKLRPIPERGEAGLCFSLDKAEVTQGIYTGKIVEL